MSATLSGSLIRSANFPFADVKPITSRAPSTSRRSWAVGWDSVASALVEYGGYGYDACNSTRLIGDSSVLSFQQS